MTYIEKISHGYFLAKKYVIKKGFGNELDWQDARDFKTLTEHDFMCEISWVILASGMNDKVVKKVFPHIQKAFFDFKSLPYILEHKQKCLQNALTVFNHTGKVSAILQIAEYLLMHTLADTKQRILKDGILFIRTFPYMGQATACHFAKNIGIDIVKADRHLIRISSSLGFDNPAQLCKAISLQVQEKLATIDLVLWRYATLDKNYLLHINQYINNIKLEISINKSVN